MTVSSDRYDDDPFADWRAALGPWKPRPLATPLPSLPRRQRAAVALAIAAGHALVLWLLVEGSRLPPSEPARHVTTLVFLSPVATPAPRPSPRVPTVEPAPATPRVASPRVAPPEMPMSTPSTSDVPPLEATAPGPGAMVAVEPPPPADRPLRLYDADGSIALPDDVIDRLAAVDGDHRVFDYQRPGLLESGRFMDRAPVLAYEGTRFDQYWIPEQPALIEILEKAVKATTGTVEIPIPGTRGGKLVCSVSLLALGGGCGVTNNNRGYVVQADDPTTLSPEEDAQCRAWWDQIVGADDQATWRQTRDLYEASCRKPLAKGIDPPA